MSPSPLENLDELGESAARIGDLNDDRTPEVMVGVPGDDDGGTDRGAVYVLFLKDDGGVERSQKISDVAGGASLSLDDGDRFGASVTDLGQMEVLVGAPGDDDGGTDRGAAYVLFLNADGTVTNSQKISDTKGGLSEPLDDGDRFGQAVAGEGFIGAPGDDGGGTDRGAVYRLSISGDGTVSYVMNTYSDEDDFLSLDDNDEFGRGLATTESFEYLVGAPGDDDGGTDRGAVYAINGSSSFQKVSDTKGGLSEPLDDGDRFGESIGKADVDADFRFEPLVGSPGDDDGGTDRGAVYLPTFDSDGSVTSVRKLSDTGGLPSSVDLKNGDRFGTAVSAGPDLDADNEADELIITAAGDDGRGTDRGAVHTLFATADGTIDGAATTSDTEGNLAPLLEDNGIFGRSVAEIGDVNGDNVDDVIVGAPLAGTGGTAYVLFLKADGTVKGVQEIDDAAGTPSSFSLDEDDGFGTSVAGLGDVNNDGTPDVLVGASEDDDGGSGDMDDNLGAAYVLFLNGADSGQPGTVSAVQKISTTTGTPASFSLDFGDLFGSGAAGIGDLDGNDVPDAVVGAPKDDDGGGGDRYWFGAAYVLFFESDGTVKTTQKLSAIEGTPSSFSLSEGAEFGTSIAQIGDLDNKDDGTTDVIVGANEVDDGGFTTDPDRGAAFVLSLKTDGTAKMTQRISDTDGTPSSFSLDNGDFFGTGVAGVGDVNDDNIPDVLVGAIGDSDGGSGETNLDDYGATYTLFLKDDGTVKGVQKISNTAGSPPGFVLEDADQFGAGLTGLGDLNSDGTPDALVGTPNDDDGGGPISDRGAAYTLFLNEGGALPVELAGLTAASTGSAVALSWRTLSETNNAGFAVQRKGPDGTWTRVGYVSSNASGGTTTQTQSYRFTDDDLSYDADALTYRLKQIDIDGSSSFSKTVTVGRDVRSVQLRDPYPNPARQTVRLRYALPERETVTIRLYDVIGRRVRTVVHTQTQGRHEQSVDVSGLPSGVYFVRLRADGHTRSAKLTVVK